MSNSDASRTLLPDFADTAAGPDQVRQRNPRRLAMPVIGRSFLVLTVLPFTQACQAECSHEMIQREESPSGSYTSALFERNCGATSGNNLQVSIFRSEIVADEPGNTFVVDYPDEYYHQNRPRPTMKLHWTSDSSVTIEYSSGARIFTQAVMVQGVKVRYVVR